MSILFSTSPEAPSIPGVELPIIHDDAAVYSTSAMTATDILLAARLIEDGDEISGRMWPITEATQCFEALLAQPENDGDYPYLQAGRALSAIRAGAALGAHTLCVD